MDKYRIYYGKTDNDQIAYSTSAQTDEVEVTPRGALLFKRNGKVILGFNEKRWISFWKLEKDEDD